MPALRVRVSASKDASFDQVFRAVQASSRDSSRMMIQQSKFTADAQLMLLKQKLAAEKAVDKQRETEIRAVNDHIRKMELARLDAKLKATRDTAKREHDLTVSEAERTARDVQRITNKYTVINRTYTGGVGGLGGGRGGGRGGSDYGRDIPYRMGYWASRNLSPVTPMLSYAARMGSDLVRGAGIDFNFGRAVSNTVGNQKLIADLVNSSFIPGAKGAAGVRQDAGAVMADVKGAANTAALDYTAGIEGLQKFVAKTGDLETGRKILGDMGLYARATGTAFEDMVDASADVSNALGDIEGKEGKIKTVMLAIAGMGKVGAVEIRDLASQMAKIGAAAGQFRGGSEQNMITLTAMMQMARARGGAASATQAATGVQSFMNMMGKEARINAFQKITGRKLYDENNQALTPEEIMLDALQATGGNKMKMGKIFADAKGRQLTRGFETIYNEAGGSRLVKFDARTAPASAAQYAQGGQIQSGLLAVIVELERLKAATMTQRQAEEAAAETLKNSEAKAKRFQNQLQDIADSMATRLFPAMEKLAPKAIEVATSFGNMINSMAENPLSIIGVALAAAIAKAGIEQTLRIGIESIFANVSGGRGGGGAVGGPPGAGPGAIGNFAAAVTIFAAAVAAYNVGAEIIKSIIAGQEKKKDDEKALIREGENAESRLRANPNSPEALAAAKAAAEKLRKTAADRRDDLATPWQALAAPGAISGPVKKVENLSDPRLVALTETQNRLLERVATAVERDSPPAAAPKGERYLLTPETIAP